MPAKSVSMQSWMMSRVNEHSPQGMFTLNGPHAPAQRNTVIVMGSLNAGLLVRK